MGPWDNRPRRSLTLNILIIRTSAMGDVVHCLPVLSALRRGSPRARIAWVVERTFAPLLEDHPDIDHLIVVRTREWQKNLLSPATRREIADLRRALRRFAPDVALDLMGNHKSGVIAWLSGAPRRVGAARPFRREASSAIWINQPVDSPGRHAVDRALAVLAGIDLPAGGGPRAERPRGGGQAEYRADFGGDKILSRVPDDARAFLEGQTRPFVVIQAGAGWGNKIYPAARWGEVARELRERTQMAVWVPIAPGEEHLAQEVVEASGGAARSVEAFGLAFLAAVLRASRLVLGGDTGPLHLAHAIGTPVLCLIGPTDPERNGPYVPPEVAIRESVADLVLFKRLPCSYCYKRYAEPKACLLNISAQEVADRAIVALERIEGIE